MFAKRFDAFLERLRKSNQMLSWENKLTVLFSQPLLMSLLPRTYWCVISNILIPKRGNVHVTGFSPHMAILLTWYLRVHKCIKRYGSHGYAYEDGLGFSLKGRFWLNPLALRIYHALRLKNFVLFTTLVLFAGLAFIGFSQEVSSWKILLLLFFIGGSPLFLIPFFRLAKPETFSWAFVPVALWAFSHGHVLVSSLLLLMIALLNFTVLLLTGQTILLVALFSGMFFQGVLALIPAALVLLYDLFPFMKRSFASGLLEVLGGRSAQSRSDEFLRVRPADLYLLFFYILFIAAAYVSRVPVAWLLALVSAFLLFVVDRNIFRFADNNTFFRFFFVLSTLILILHPTSLLLGAYLLFLYISPLALMESIERVWEKYPHLHSYSLEESTRYLQRHIARIPEQSRIAFEISDSEKSLAGFSTFLFYFEYLALEKGIEMIPMEWLRLTNLAYFTEEYVKMNGDSSRETIKSMCKELGASFIMAHSENFSSRLLSWGYEEIFRIRWKELKKYLWNADRVLLPEKDIRLFSNPFQTSFVDPPAVLTRLPNSMEFFASSARPYLIRYNYHPSWKAYQNHNQIAITRADGKLKYLVVHPQAEGKVKLWFDTNPFR